MASETSVDIDGCNVGRVVVEDESPLFYPATGTCLSADEMVEIANKMKEMEKK